MWVCGLRELRDLSGCNCRSPAMKDLSFLSNAGIATPLRKRGCCGLERLGRQPKLQRQYQGSWPSNSGPSDGRGQPFSLPFSFHLHLQFCTHPPLTSLLGGKDPLDGTFHGGEAAFGS